MNWKVLINGIDTGIVESNISFATKYWAQQAKKRGYHVKLVMK